ncbi:fimbrial protein [Pseudomonas protegens]|uniref:fimbrial protein n=1 Tax=Pseudomonas TaxID=286 RepID=UPI003208669E
MSTRITSQELGGLKVPRDAPIGSVIYTREIDQGKASISCTASWGEKLWLDHGFVGGATLSSYGQNVYLSGIPGIGMRIYWYHEGGAYMSHPRFTRQIQAYNYQPPQKFRFELVKVGPISSGSSSNQIVRIYYHNQLSNELIFSNVAFVAQNSGCEAQAVPPIELPTVLQREFKQQGLTVGSKDFSIDLLCDRGIRVAYRVDGPTNKDNVLLNAQGDGMARGVGIQLFQGHGGSTMVQALGSRTDLAIASGTQDQQPLSIPLNARYIQTAPTVEGGKVWSNATVSFFYE